MTRTVSATISTAVDQTVTKPIYLVRMGWVVENRSCSYDANITWNAETWTASGLSVVNLDSDGGTLILPIGDADPWLDLVNDESQRNRTVVVYEYQTDYTVSPAVADAVAIFSGIMDDATIGKDIRISMIEDQRYKAFPPTSIDETVYTYLLRSGQTIIWRETVITVE